MLFLAAAAVLFGADPIPFCKSVHKENEVHRHSTTFWILGSQNMGPGNAYLKVASQVHGKVWGFCFFVFFVFYFKLRSLESSGFSKSICSPDVLGLQSC